MTPPSGSHAHARPPRDRGRRVAYLVAAAFVLGVVVGVGSLGFLLSDDLMALVRRGKRLPATEALALIRKAKDESVIVYAESEQGGQRGSGFVLRRWGDDAVVVTNAHVVLDDAEKLLARFAVRGARGDRLPAYPLTWDHHFPERDVAMLVVHDPDHHLGDAARIGGNPRTGDYVVCVGSPRGDELLPTEGHVLSVVPDAELIEHDCLTDKGSSGGPVLNAGAEVIGIHTYGLPDDTHYAIDLSRFTAEISLAHATVPARGEWHDTGLDVPKGASVLAIALGAWTVPPAPAALSANGSDDASLAARGAYPERPFGALVCRLGDAGATFALSNRAGVPGAAPYGGVGAAEARARLSCRPNAADTSSADGALTLVAIAQLPSPPRPRTARSR